MLKAHVSESAIEHWNKQQLPLGADSIASSLASSHHEDDLLERPLVDPEICESPSAGNEDPNHGRDTDLQTLTLLDGSQIIVSRANYTHVDSSHHGNPQQETPDNEQPIFQPRPQGFIVSSTTEENSSELLQTANLILTQSQEPEGYLQSQPNSASIHPTTQPDTPVSVSNGAEHFYIPPFQDTTINSLPEPPDPQFTFETSQVDYPPAQPGLLSSLIPGDLTLSSSLRMSSHPAVPAQVVETLQLSSHSSSTTPGEPSQTTDAPDSLEIVPASAQNVYNGMHLIGLAMVPTQREQYLSIPEPDDVDVIDRIIGLGSQEMESDLLEEGDAILRRLRSIATHPDLDTSEAMTQYDVPADIQAEWDSQCSTKFLFLRQLIEHAENRGLHIVIAVDGGQELRLVTRFLRGLDVPLADTISDDVATTRVTIMDEELPAASIKPADVVIGLNTVWNGEPPLVYGRHGIPAPCVQLVVQCTIEHMEISLPRGLSKQSRVKVLLENVQSLKQRLRGLRNDDTVSPAHILVDQLTSSTDPWLLTELSKLLLQIDNTTVEYENARSSSDRKRSLEDADDEMDTKRRRLDVNSSDDGLQARLDAAENRRDQLEKDLLYARMRLSEFETSTETLFDTTYDLRTDLHNAQKERNNAVETVARLEPQLQAKKIAVSALQDEQKTLKEQLRNANYKLLSHVVPERVELERHRIAAQEAAENVAKAQESVKSMSSTLTYAQAQYQQASAVAAQLAEENKELTMRLKAAEKVAELELSKLRKMNLDKLTELALQDIKKLKSTLVSREAELNIRDVEIAQLKDAARGRIGTRASSVPRSPRMGSPMKQLLSDGVASRHGSPVPGERGARLHPLRNGM